jgi:hypothetical protein
VGLCVAGPEMCAEAEAAAAAAAAGVAGRVAGRDYLVAPLGRVPWKQSTYSNK